VTDAICPTCGKLIDPARAPVARIREGRVLTYCSTECADAEASGRVPAVVASGARGEETEGSKAWYREGEALARRPRTQSSGAPVAVPRGHTWDEAASAAAAAEAGAGAVDAAALSPRGGAGRRLPIAIFGVLAAAGVALIGMELLGGGGDDDAVAGEAAALPSEVEPAPVEPPAKKLTPSEAAAIAADPELVIDRDKARATAVKLLEKRLESSGARARNAAAMALSRLGDPRATKVLAEAISDETSFARRHQMAFALARADDPRGVEVLKAALGSSRRDERTDAASRLAELGDDSGKKQLDTLMNNKRLKLSAAASLALLGNDEGLAELRAAVGDKKAPEARLRALVALGRAGHADVQEGLRAILEADEFNVGASAALAVLGDRSAIPALEAQLASPSLRVDAAVSLRRFDDADPDLRALVSSLSTGDELASIKAAEALLILLADEKPAEL